MLDGARIIVAMPGKNVAQTIERTVKALPPGIADAIILVDDGSTDSTAAEGRRLGLRVYSHAHNLGYGASQKTGYREALRAGAEIVVLLHPDFQYMPELMPVMAAMVRYGGYDLVLASRVLDGGAVTAGGMPLWKYVANRLLTKIENVLLGAHVSEYHTGYRAFSKRILERLPLASLSNAYHFDSELLALAVLYGYRIGEISCPARYGIDGMQTISPLVGMRYGMGCLRAAVLGAAQRSGLVRPALYRPDGPHLEGGWHEGQERL